MRRRVPQPRRLATLSRESNSLRLSSAIKSVKWRNCVMRNDLFSRPSSSRLVSFTMPKCSKKNRLASSRNLWLKLKSSKESLKNLKDRKKCSVLN